MSITFFNQWRQLFHLGSMNWLDFDFINISWEIDKMTEDFGIDVALFGFGFHVHYVSRRMRRYFDSAMESCKDESKNPDFSL